MKSIKTLTAIFILTLTFIATACAGNKDNKSVYSQKEQSDMEVIALTEADFLKKVYNYEANPNEWKFEGNRPAIIDFYATWCGPCKMMHPILDELKERLGDKVRILKIDVDVPANRQSVYAYQIQSVPTLMLFKKGRMLWRQSGVVRVPRLEEIIKPYLAS